MVEQNNNLFTIYALIRTGKTNDIHYLGCDRRLHAIPYKLFKKASEIEKNINSFLHNTNISLDA